MIERTSGRPRWIWVVPTALALIVLMAAGLMACTGGSSGGDSPKPSSGANPSATAGLSAEAAKQVTEQYLKPVTPPVLASVRGTVEGSKRVPGTADLLAVEAGPNSTLVRWRMSTDEPIDFVSTGFYSNKDLSVPDTSAVVLVAKQANLLLKTGHWSGSMAASWDCTCAWAPHFMDSRGVELSILYPALPASVTQVELRVPGFPPLSASVTRS